MSRSRRLLLLKKKLLLLKLTQRRTQRQRRERRWAVHPLWRSRKFEGHYNTLMKAMREHDVTYFRRFTRMTPQRYDHLLGLISQRLKKRYLGSTTLTPSHRLAITLRFLASGDSYQSVAFAFRVGICTVHSVVKETCAVLWDVLQPLYLPSPTTQLWEKSAQEYDARWNFPSCCGAVDGKHIQLQQPAKTGSLYYNYKGTNSLVLMAVVDPYCKYLAVDVGAYGSSSDGGIWKSSPIGKAMENGTLGLPVGKCIPDTNIFVPHVLVGDEAFQLRPDFMRPYPAQGLNILKRIFNYRLSRARRCSECCFGITANRWRVYRRPLLLKPENAELVVKATVVLHNYLMTEISDIGGDETYCPAGYNDSMYNNGELREGLWCAEHHENGALQPAFNTRARNFTAEAANNRHKFSCYFVSEEGEVDWQWSIPGLKALE